MAWTKKRITKRRLWWFLLRQCTDSADRKENYAHRIISNAFFVRAVRSFHSLFDTVGIEHIYIKVFFRCVLFLFYSRIDWFNEMQTGTSRRMKKFQIWNSYQPLIAGNSVKDSKQTERNKRAEIRCVFFPLLVLLGIAFKTKAQKNTIWKRIHANQRCKMILSGLKW